MINADAFREIYRHHFKVNRILWDYSIAPLTQEQFIDSSVSYSYGSVRNQVVHMFTVDNLWFASLQDLPFPGDLLADDFNDRDGIRAKWDEVEAGMRAYLDALTDDMLNMTVYDPDDDDLQAWKILFHVVNHGTDHRAQMLRLVSDLGGNTFPQDYAFHTLTYKG
jgi:uncharacterized damage-inducible protein DinB